MKYFLKSFAPDTPLKKVIWAIGVVVISVITALNVAYLFIGNGGYAYGYTFTLQGATPDQINTYTLDYARAQLNPVDSTTKVVFQKSVTSEELVSLGLDAVNPGTIDQPRYVLVVLKGNFDITSNNVQYMYAPPELKKPWKYASVVFDVNSSQPAHKLFHRMAQSSAKCSTIIPYRC